MKGRKAKANAKGAKGSQDQVLAAIAAHQSGKLDEAEKAYRSALQADPDNVDALHYLGVLRYQQGQPAAAVELVLRALELRPHYFDALNNLGNIYLRFNAGDAADAYRKALELRPGEAGASRNLGVALRRLKRHEEAVELFEGAIHARPDVLEGYYSLSIAYKELRRDDDAVATLRKALAIKPESEGFRRLGQMLYALRRTDEATAHYEAWLRADPGNPIARHMLAACTSKDVPARAGDAFVAQVFDGFADSFDDVLMGRLEYRAPALVGEALARVDGAPRGELDILDAGCGTGLLARYLRPYARRLVGVDLSPRMLEKAAARARYDELIVAELGWYLGASPGAFDVVASSDTLVYFGELGEVAAAAAAALRPGGRFLFTLEHASGEAEAPAGYCIQPHGRYSHTEPYVRAIVTAAGFEIIEMEKAPLRRERFDYVPGLVVAARLAGRRAHAVAGPPATAVEDNLNRAAALQRQGQLQQAEAAYLAVLRADPENVPALHALGAMRFEQGWSLSALNLVSRAIELEAGRVEAYMTLGRIHHKLGTLAGAAHAYRKALELAPEHAGAAKSLAPILAELKSAEESAEQHRRALERDPANVRHLLELASAYQKTGRADEELAALRQALAVRPETDAFVRLGTMLRGMGRFDEAAASYEAWLRAEPNNPVARHMLAACTGTQVPERASDAFVAREFDQFAESFDETLRKLEYRAPALVGRALHRTAGEPHANLDVLDAGCGTGLLAQHLRPYARRLVGVDLSPKMLEKAAGRRVYHELVAGELTAYLASARHAFDLVASSDTLNYFGDLRAALAAAAAALRPNGKLLFTVEHAAGETGLSAGYRMHPDGRYMHTQEYVRRVLGETGFEVIDIETAYLRREGLRYVEGLVVVAARAADGAGSDASSSRNP